MPNYKTMYFQLAAKVADAIDLLVEAQRQGEASYSEGSDPQLRLFRPEEDDEEPEPVRS